MMSIVDAHTLAGEVARRLGKLLEPQWQPLPHQKPPAGNWYGWLLLAGRGAGKTAASANYINQHALGPPCLNGPVPHWMGIVAPTLGDAATSCYSGPSGLRAHNPDTRLVSGAGGLVVRWPNGAEAKLFGASAPDDVERLRSGGNRCVAWLEELAAWRYLDDCWDHVRFGLRQGPRPHWVASTTPKPRELIKSIVAGKIPNVVTSFATTKDNPYLDANIRNMLFDRYGGTTLGSQELLGLIMDEDENALWTRECIERNRVDVAPDDLSRISVGVDPSGGSGEQGISVVGRTRPLKGMPHGFVLADYTCRLSPSGWGKRAVDAAVDFHADNICVETNFGGDMAMSVVRQAVDSAGLSIPIKKLTASRGKRPRAEPVAAAALNDRLHHAGVFSELEDQLCTWTPDSPNSPDRLDAMVWAAWSVKLVSLLTTRSGGQYAGNILAQTKIA